MFPVSVSCEVLEAMTVKWQQIHAASISYKRNQCSLEKQLILKLWQGIHEENLEQLLVI